MNFLSRRQKEGPTTSSTPLDKTFANCDQLIAECDQTLEEINKLLAEHDAQDIRIDDFLAESNAHMAEVITSAQLTAAETTAAAQAAEEQSNALSLELTLLQQEATSPALLEGLFFIDPLIPND